MKTDILMIRKWGSSGNYSEFPYKISDSYTLPEHDMSANDVDLDAYTNTKGYTIRNRERHDVATLEFNVPTMTGKELHDLFQMTTHEWLDCKFFYEPSWAIVSKKMYRSGTVTYHRYYTHPTDPLQNTYTDVNFSFVEQ